MDKNLFYVLEIMKHISHLHVIFNNHKFYFVAKVNKNTLALGIEHYVFLGWLKHGR
jgi:hypothetical protein